MGAEESVKVACDWMRHISNYEQKIIYDKDRIVCSQIEIPEDKLSHLIGRDGQNINDLRNFFCAQIRIIKDKGKRFVVIHADRDYLDVCIKKITGDLGMVDVIDHCKTEEKASVFQDRFAEPGISFTEIAKRAPPPPRPVVQARVAEVARRTPELGDWIKKALEHQGPIEPKGKGKKKDH